MVLLAKKPAVSNKASCFSRLTSKDAIRLFASNLIKSILKRFNMLFIKFEANNRIAFFEVNREKQDALLLTAGFFASKTIGVDLDPLAARDNYGMRDDQEKAFALQK